MPTTDLEKTDKKASDKKARKDAEDRESKAMELRVAEQEAANEANAEGAFGFYDQMALEEDLGLDPAHEGESPLEFAKRRREAERAITEPEDQPDEVK